MATLNKKPASSSSEFKPAEIWLNVDLLNPNGKFEQVGGLPLELTKALHRDVFAEYETGGLDELVVRLRVNDLRDRAPLPEGQSRFAKKSDFQTS